MMIIIACGIMISVGIYLLLEPSMLRRVFGLVVLGSAINMIILVCGRLHSTHPVFIDGHIHSFANPLPQALILTAIVIGFGLLALLSCLLKLHYPSQAAGEHQ